MCEWQCILLCSMSQITTGCRDSASTNQIYILFCWPVVGFIHVNCSGANVPVLELLVVEMCLHLIEIHL